MTKKSSTKNIPSPNLRPELAIGSTEAPSISNVLPSNIKNVLPQSQPVTRSEATTTTATTTATTKPKPQIRTQLKPKQVIEPLKISEKRKLVTGLSRKLLKQEPILTKLLRYFVDKNLLADPVKQNFESDINLESNKGKLGARIYFDITGEQRKALNFNTLYKEVNSLNKELKVSLVFDPEKDNFIHVVTIYNPTMTAKGTPLKKKK